MAKRILIAAAALGMAAVPALARMPTEAEKLRQQAEHLCYGDVQKLCNDAIPDEDKIKACMEKRHAELSPACAKVYDQGIDG